VLLGFEFQCFFQDDEGVPGSWIELADRRRIAAGRRSGSLFRNAGGATRISSSSRPAGGRFRPQRTIPDD
jgi:hypothetical protein